MSFIIIFQFQNVLLEAGKSLKHQQSLIPLTFYMASAKFFVLDMRKLMKTVELDGKISFRSVHI